MVDQIKGMTEEQVRQFLKYVDAEIKALEISREQRDTSGRLDLAYYDKMELGRLRQTKGVFLEILRK